MKHLIILLFLAVLIADSPAQKPIKWKPLKGPNTSSSSNQLLIGANNEIISVGKTGYYSSENDGASWEYHKVISDIPCFKSPVSGLLIASSGEYYFYFGTHSCGSENNMINGVYRSTDKGNNWKRILSGQDVVFMEETVNHEIFLAEFDNSQQYGYSIYESIDKGSSWTSVNYSSDIPFFFGSNNKYLYYYAKNTSPGFIFRLSLTDGKVEDFTNGMYVSNIRSALQVKTNLFMAAGYIANQNQTQFFTSDGESQWSNIGSLPGGVTIFKGTGDTVFSLVLSTDNKTQSIFSSINWGHDWSKYADLPLSTGQINCANSERKLFENDTALYLSRDKGNSWIEIGMPYDSISTIISSEEGRIFAEPTDRFDINQYVYNYFDLQISSNKGESWHKSEPAKMKIKKIGKGINGGIIAIAPDSSKPNTNCVWVFDSTVPTSWRKAAIVTYIESHPLIASDDTKSIYIASNYNGDPAIYRSDDNGFTWENVNAPLTTNPIYSLGVSTDGTVYFGSYSVMYRSDDKGATWVKLLPVHDIVKLSYIKTFGQSGVLLGTEGDGLLISNDKGNSWTRLDGKKFDTVTCIAVTSKGEVVAGTNKGLWLSDSSKQIWSKVALGNNSELYIGALDVAKNDDIYVGTYGSSVWVGSRNYNAVNYYSPISHSAMQLSPNPTTGKVAITLEGISDEKISLELYDILGRKISTILEGKYSGEINFNTSNLPNGIYTFMLSGERYNEEKKLVVQH